MHDDRADKSCPVFVISHRYTLIGQNGCPFKVHFVPFLEASSTESMEVHMIRSGRGWRARRPLRLKGSKLLENVHWLGSLDHDSQFHG
jgi:hypothetical protein